MRRIGAIFPRKIIEPKAAAPEPTGSGSSKGKRSGKGKKEEKPCTPTMSTTEKSTGES